MAIGDYRYRIPGGSGGEPQVAIDGMVRFNVFIEVCTEDTPEEVWSQIPLGHLTVPIAGTVLEACTDANQALQCIEEYIKTRGMAQSHRARRAVLDLLPGGTWPENDVTRPISLP